MIQLTNRLFQTHPVLAHAPGPLGNGFQRLCQAVWALPRRSVRCDDLTIITFNSGSRTAKPCGVFERSLAQLGIEPLVLGQGVPKWTNLKKVRLTLEALAQVTTPFVLAADSCDVLLLDSPAILLERFQQHFSCDLVFNSTGSGCWPELPEFVRFESGLPMAAVAQGRHWLNAGVWIGRTEFAREFFASLAASPPVAGWESSDQALIKRHWPRWYPRVQLDYLSIMFQWINDDRSVVQIARPLAVRQRELLELLRPLGRHLSGAEIGVWDGETSEALLRELPDLELWMIDPWRPYDGQSNTGNLPQESFDRARESALWWTAPALRRRHVLPEASPSAARHFAERSLDFVFIDGNHLYEAVRDDIVAWWPKIRPGGVIAGHDYGVYRDADGAWGVRRAVDEFAANVRCSIGVGQDGVWWVRN